MNRWWVVDEDGTLLSTFRTRWFARRWIRHAKRGLYSPAPALRWQVVLGPRPPSRYA